MNFFRCLFMIASLLLVSCKKEQVILDEVVELHVLPKWNNDLIHLDSSYEISTNLKIRFTEIKFYWSDLKLNENKNISVAFFDQRKNSSLLWKGQKDFELLSSFTGKFGIDSLTNHSDPSAFELTNPLNILTANDMHWSWNPGYIFLKIQAQVDTVGQGNFNHFIDYHIGKDVNYLALGNVPIKWTKVGGLNRGEICLAANLWFNSIDVLTENKCHSAVDEMPLSSKIAVNFIQSITACHE